MSEDRGLPVFLDTKAYPLSTTAIKEDIGAFFGAGPAAASGAAMETTEEEEKEATEAVAAPESQSKNRFDLRKINFM